MVRHIREIINEFIEKVGIDTLNNATLLENFTDEKKGDSDDDSSSEV